jgi:drug/metabolite transporter (DMT)-like permease
MGAPLSYQQITGIAIITGSIALYFAKGRLLQSKLRISAPSLAIICAFASTVPTAISTYFQKDAIALSTPLFISFFICAFSAAASFAYLLASGNKTFPALTVKSLLPLVMIALLQAIAALSFSAYVAQGHPAIAQALQRLSSLLQILLAHLFLRQRFNTPWHLLCVGFSVFGLMILFST